MTHLYCTQKLRKLLGFAETAFSVTESERSAFDLWYGNLLWLERRKCLLITHKVTLYCLFIPDVKKADLKDLKALLSHRLGEQLRAEGIHEAAIQTLIGTEPLGLGKARDRRVLGSMNDQAYQLRFYVEDEGGLAKVDLVALMKRVNRTPMKKSTPQNKTGHYIYPVEELKRRLA